MNDDVFDTGIDNDETNPTPPPSGQLGGAPKPLTTGDPMVPGIPNPSPKFEDDPFVRSVKALLDIIALEPKHSTLDGAYRECKLEYDKLIEKFSDQD